MTVPSALSRRLIRRRVEAQMTSTVQVLRGSPGQLDLDTGDVGGLDSADIVYEGPARIRAVSGGAVVLGEGMLESASTVVSIPMSAPVPRRDDLVQLTGDVASDADLDDRVFRVLDVDGGGYFGDARRLTCQGWHGSRYWSDS